MKRRYLWILAIAIAIAAGGYLLFFKGRGANNSQAKGPAHSVAVAIAVDTVTKRNVGIRITAIGTVEAHRTVTLKSRVDGQILTASFRQGQAVHSGDVLFTIDPRGFEALLSQAQANLARDAAQLDNARRQSTRYADLVKEGFISKEKFEEVKSTMLALEGTVKADEAAVASAQLQLSYTTVRSPISGVTGSILAYPGNLVKVNDTALVVINQIQPVYVTFSIPQEKLAEIKRHLNAGAVPIEASFPNDTAKPMVGDLAFINNAVDVATGTIVLKGLFKNPKNLLTPGQFVNVSLKLATREPSLVIPAQALQRNQTGDYVFVVKNDSTVEQRPVKVAAATDGHIAIEAGLAEGERVVTDGQFSLTPGAHVTIKPSVAARDGNAS